MCANARKAGKKKIGAYFPEEERDELERIAAQYGMNLSDFIRECVSRRIQQVKGKSKNGE